MCKLLDCLAELRNRSGGVMEYWSVGAFTFWIAEFGFWI
jgi:hypothetical protein